MAGDNFRKRICHLLIIAALTKGTWSLYCPSAILGARADNIRVIISHLSVHLYGSGFVVIELTEKHYKCYVYKGFPSLETTHRVCKMCANLELQCGCEQIVLNLETACGCEQIVFKSHTASFTKFVCQCVHMGCTNLKTFGNCLSFCYAVARQNKKIIWIWIWIIWIWRNGHILQVAENWENNCLCFQLCFAELKYYQRRSEKFFELILVFQGGFWYALY